MRRALLPCLVLLVFSGCNGGSTSDTVGATRACVPLGERQLRCTIKRPSDCDALRDYPYARTLQCPAAFAAAQHLIDSLAAGLDVEAPRRGTFYYYQTLADQPAPPDEQAQTVEHCLRTTAPWGSTHVVGAGKPLCRLIAYVMSPGPLPRNGGGDPIPSQLRRYPEYFSGLYEADGLDELTDFRTGSAYDRSVRGLGAAAHEQFLRDYPAFATDAPYDPANWQRDPQYAGISGGGGGGWGGEVGIAPASGDDTVLLAFGGGGGGGMTSMRDGAHWSSRIGGGGGGGVQLADGYRCGERLCAGLGLGAGVGSEERDVQYSYFDYPDSQRPPQPVHDYNPAVIGDYQTQIGALIDQLRARVAAGETVVLRGGGGMGAGAEYLRANGEAYEPHALSTQAGFQFRYLFGTVEDDADADEPELQQADVYERLGPIYRAATKHAFEACGRDYANYNCMCAATHEIVVRKMAEALGDLARVPPWLRQRHCPDDTARARAAATRLALTDR
ncbi:MAG: hypothetical protein SF182_00035 [Deltaproteobacteria bacterium]|nr:hypothetical protein [Deltaproteobacteria bacterium]